MARTLVVDDDPHMLRVLAMWLTRNGHQVTEACNGAVARRALEDGEVDLVISDVNMPEMDGLELVQWVRAHKGTALPMIVLSSRCDQESIAARLKAYGVHLLPKPFSPSRLVVEVDRLLGATAGVGDSSGVGACQPGREGQGG